MKTQQNELKSQQNAPHDVLLVHHALLAVGAIDLRLVQGLQREERARGHVPHVIRLEASKAKPKGHERI